MSVLGISFIDVLVVAIIIASTAFAIYRGFVRETLFIFAWAAAAFATLYFGPAVSSLLRGMLSQFAAYAVAYIGTFLLVLIPLSFVSYRFSETVNRSPVSALDRALGAAFGVLRGLAVVGLAYMFFSMIVPIPKQPEWMTEARLLPLIQSSSDVLLTLVPNQDRAAAPGSRTAPKKTTQTAKKAAPASKFDADRKPTKTRKKTYGADDRRALDNLIEATGNGGNDKP